MHRPREGGEGDDCLGLGLDFVFDIDCDFFGEPHVQPEQMELYNDGWLNAVLFEASQASSLSCSLC